MTIIYLLCLVLNAGIYMLLLGHNYGKHKKYLDDIREGSVRLIRHIDLNEQYEMLITLHELQSEQPNISRSDTAMMNLLNEYIEKTSRQLRYMENKNEPSKKDSSSHHVS